MKRGAILAGSAWALVTGAGTGIGRCYALRLAALGYNVVLAGLAREPLEKVRAEILAAAAGQTANGRLTTADHRTTADDRAAADNRTTADNRAADHRAAAGEGRSTCRPTTTNYPTAASRTSSPENTADRHGNPATDSWPCVRIIEIDLAREEASDALYAAVKEAGIAIDVLVNNAGIFSFNDILATPSERIARMILLHDMTLSKNCLAFGRDMAARGRGWILNMSSYSIWMPFPGMALYTATKAYVRSFSVAFAKEVCDRGVHVTAVCPAGVATDLYGLTPRWQRIGLKLGVLISADSCARRGLRALWRGRRTIVPDWWNRAFIPFCKLMPMCMLRPIRRYTMKFQK